MLLSSPGVALGVAATTSTDVSAGVAVRASAPVRGRFLSEAECHDIAQRLGRFAKGGGETAIHLISRWRGNVRWARNRITTSGEDRDNRIFIKRDIRGARTWPDTISFNEVSDDALVAATRRAERLVTNELEHGENDIATRPGSPFRFQDEPVTVPTLFYDATYNLDADHRAAAAWHLMHAAAAAGMLSAGYIEVSATSFAYITSWGYARYYQYTWAQYSTTVRDPKGVGSGWAGVDWPDWSKIEGEHLSAIALDKCLKSRNPVAVEPGRYTTILEPQAVCDFVAPWRFQEDRANTEQDPKRLYNRLPGTEPPVNDKPYVLGQARFGERVIDERLTISTDPLDPTLSFPPFDQYQEDVDDGAVYHPAVWIERGVLKALPYGQSYAIQQLGKFPGLPSQGALKISVTGTPTPIPEMIATTKRGILVTRFDQVQGPDEFYRCSGFTRDGLWLIEHGAISKPIKNFLFLESIIFALNNVEQVGAPQRCFHPGRGDEGSWYSNPQPSFVPALKIKDFAFIALSDAI